MGIVRMGAPREFVLELQKQFNINCFVEAGTYLGQTAVWAADNFDTVVTIENSKSLYDQTVAKYGSINNIRFIYGHTKDVLNNVFRDIQGPSIIWLDSHWCGGESYGESDQCPLIDEIKIINQFDNEKFILIDDARLFLSPPPLPNNSAQWPTIDKVIEELVSSKKQRYIVVFEDVIIAVPEYSRDIVCSWCQKKNTAAWAEHAENIPSSKSQTVLKKFWNVLGK